MAPAASRSSGRPKILARMAPNEGSGGACASCTRVPSAASSARQAASDTPASSSSSRGATATFSVATTQRSPHRISSRDCASKPSALQIGLSLRKYTTGCW
jgi:hypothetical protein